MANYGNGIMDHKKVSEKYKKSLEMMGKSLEIMRDQENYGKSRRIMDDHRKVSESYGKSLKIMGKSLEIMRDYRKIMKIHGELLIIRKSQKVM